MASKSGPSDLEDQRRKIPDAEEQTRIRFQVELEFVQCLGNPNYLNFLAQRGYFKESTFINYLKYLLYWKEPAYAKYLKYPMCLYFLDLLQYEHFRRELVNAQCSKFIDDQQILLWQHYTRRRSRLMLSQQQQQQQQTAAGCGVGSMNGGGSGVGVAGEQQQGGAAGGQNVQQTNGHNQKMGG